MPDESDPDLTFEHALGHLEKIVPSLERGEPELTAALAKYEKGVQSAEECHRLLDQAEQSVALLTGVDADGNPLTAPFDATCHCGHAGSRFGRACQSRGRDKSPQETENADGSPIQKKGPASPRRPEPEGADPPF